MAARTTGKSAKRATVKSSRRRSDSDSSCFGFELGGWVQTAKEWSAAQARSGARGWVLLLSHNDPKKAMAHLRGDWGAQIQQLSKWQQKNLSDWLESRKDSDVFHLPLKDGPVWILRVLEAEAPAKDPLVKSDFARARDAAGGIFQALKPMKLERVILDFADASRDEALGFLTGLEIASYSFAESRGYRDRARKPALLLRTPESLKAKELAREASSLGVAVNLARHLTNLPGGTLTPASFAEFVTRLFRPIGNVKVETWEEARLREEKMNLLLAVGGGAQVPPRLVHISYRPRVRGAETKPVALVGKGITFDSGGLDIKPSSGMRWMKKDMGGSAAALALTWWAATNELPLALDTYMPLAENAISAKSFRPGDIVQARNGLAIEIHNTDAEGRLVLADAMAVAIEAKGDDQPACLIDLATLTGAIKVGLGTEIAGLFTNSDDLAREIFDAGLRRGDLSWRMPLFQPYKSSLRSPYADHVNASDGYAGAITAALFLELFAQSKAAPGIPWAHLDIYAWRDSASGAWTEPGGNGQSVLALSEVLSRFVSGKWAEE